MVPETFPWHTPTVVLFRFPPVDRHVALCPLSFTYGCVVIPLCHSQSFFDVLGLLLPFLQPFRDLAADFLPAQAMVQSLCFFVPSSLLHPRHLFSSDQPMSYNLFCTQPPHHDQLPRHMLVLFRPHLICISSQQILDRIQPRSCLQFLTLGASLPTFSNSPSWLVSNVSVLWMANRPHRPAVRGLGGCSSSRDGRSKEGRR